MVLSCETSTGISTSISTREHKDVQISDIRIRSVSHVGNIFVSTSICFRMWKETEALKRKIKQWRNNMAEEEALFAELMLVNITKVLLHFILIIIPWVNKLSSICAFAYLISNLALVRSHSTLTPFYVRFWSQPTIYRTELDTSGQVLPTSHLPILLTERRSGTVLFWLVEFLGLCLGLFQTSSH